MLRRDGSRPATDHDQRLIDYLSSEHAPDAAAFDDVEIKLVGPNKPCTPRWESFSWDVPSDTEHAFYKAEAARRREEETLFQSALGKLTDAERNVVLARMRVH
jgi:hypothetical protein